MPKKKSSSKKKKTSKGTHGIRVKAHIRNGFPVRAHMRHCRKM